MEISLNLYQTMALATTVFFVGKFLTEKIPVLKKFCIPAPVVGGVIYALIILGLRISGVAMIVLDTTLQNIFMTIFFTSIGFTASMKLLKAGGVKVFVFLGCAVGLVILQDILGVTLAKLFNLPAILGLATGSIPMVGGHGTSGAFGPMLEDMGIAGATTVAFASATFGLIMGCLIGNVIARTLINRNNIVTPFEETQGEDKENLYAVDSSQTTAGQFVTLSADKLTAAAGFLFVAAGLGTIVSAGFDKLGMTMPSYIGAMVVAAVIRNIFDAKHMTIPEKEINTTGTVCLSFFLSLALMSLKLWELMDLAIPMIVMLFAQTLLMGAFAYLVIFNIMGRNYDAVVFASACCGFGMGATPNAVANMDALTKRYGYAPVPYFVVPLVGCLFIDFCNSLVLTVFIHFLH